MKVLSDDLKLLSESASLYWLGKEFRGSNRKRSVSIGFITGFRNS